MAAALASALVLRLWMLSKLFEVNGDALIYGGIARNLLEHGSYALTVQGVAYPTLIRLPGFPLLVAACFRLFGMENYASVCWVAIAMELAGCLLLFLAARRMVAERWRGVASHGALWFAALCPFTASYTAAPLAEAPTLFAIAAAVFAAVVFADRPGWRAGLGLTAAMVFAALLRPDGVLVGVALLPAVFFGLRRLPLRVAIRMATVCLLLALTPFAIWTARNWRTFEVFEPLAPRLAIDPDEQAPMGWEAWIKSWCLDFVSTYQVYWNVPDSPLEMAQLPARAFDSPAQYAETAAIFDDYNNASGMKITPELDQRFGRLAAERARSHPWRTRLWLPLGRVADMWVRPRVENLPIDLDWWNYSHHNAETRFAWFYVGLNALYLVLGLVGLCFRPRLGLSIGLYFVLRSLLLMTVEAPEARYTLECFPMLCLLAGVALAGATQKSRELAGRFCRSERVEQV